MRTVTTSSSRPLSVREKWTKALKQPMRRQSLEKSSMGGMLRQTRVGQARDCSAEDDRHGKVLLRGCF